MPDPPGFRSHLKQPLNLLVAIAPTSALPASYHPILDELELVLVPILVQHVWGGKVGHLTTGKIRRMSVPLVLISHSARRK